MQAIPDHVPYQCKPNQVLVDAGPDDFYWYRDCRLWERWISIARPDLVYEFQVVSYSGLTAHQAIVEFIRVEDAVWFQLAKPASVLEILNLEVIKSIG